MSTRVVSSCEDGGKTVRAGLELYIVSAVPFWSLSQLRGMQGRATRR